MSGDKVWIIQAKAKWSAVGFDTALGQILVSDSLYRKDKGLKKGNTQPALLLGGLPNTLRSYFSDVSRIGYKYI